MDFEMDLKAKMEGGESTNDRMREGVVAERSISEQQKRVTSSLEVDVNIVDCLPTPHQGLQKEEICTYSTDSLSSFGDSDVSIGNTEGESQSEPTVEESEISVKQRKNKLTDQWKSFIRPLMWRSKWLELHLKDLREQALKYDRELLEYEGKKFLLGTHVVEEFNAKTSSFSDHFRPQKIMKRIKRKSLEENTDYASYISHHNVFSFLGNYNLTTDSSNAHTNWKGYNKRRETCEEDVVWDLIDPKEDASQEVEIFKKIEAIQARVRALISRVDNLMNEYSDHSSMNSQSLADHSAQFGGPAPHPCEDSSLGNATPISHIFDAIDIENAVFETESEEHILINNQAAEEEMKNLRNVGLQCSNSSHEQ